MLNKKLAKQSQKAIIHRIRQSQNPIRPVLIDIFRWCFIVAVEESINRLWIPTLCAFSRGSAPLMRMPLEAPTPVPTMTAVGVASPSAHGQAIASTVSAIRNPNCHVTSAALQ